MKAPVDHRQLGHELGIYTTSELVGSGFPLWLPAGATIRQQLADYVLELERRAGYQHVVTPSLAKEALFELSGHLRWFADEMFPAMPVGEENVRLRPVNCPHHVLVYRHGDGATGSCRCGSPSSVTSTAWSAPVWSVG